jgi:hypothetical protein
MENNHGVVSVKRAVVPYSPLAYSQRLISLKVRVPERTPLPVQVPAVCEEVLSIVPSINPGPLAIQLIFFIEMTSDPEMRSLVATIVKVILLFTPALALQLREIWLEGDEIIGASSGLRLPTSKDIAVVFSSSFDKFLTSAFIVSWTCLVSAEGSAGITIRVKKAKMSVILLSLSIIRAYRLISRQEFFNSE